MIPRPMTTFNESAATALRLITDLDPTLLAIVGQILASHAPYKRSYDAQFKAFVCAGLK